MALRKEKSLARGSTGTTSSSSPVAKGLDAVNVTLPLLEGQRSPVKLNKEVIVGETMNHPGVSSSPTGPSSPAKISQVFSEALRQDREDAEGDDDSQEEGEIDILELKRRNLVCDRAQDKSRSGRDLALGEGEPQLSVEATLPVEVLAEDIPMGLVQGDSVSKTKKEIVAPEKAKDTINLGPAIEVECSAVSLLPRSFCSNPVHVAESSSLWIMSAASVQSGASPSFGAGCYFLPSSGVGSLHSSFESILGLLPPFCLVA
ncbi:hypothetical protein U1Q18_050044 [Sarracenia purpurea var. burkii]